MRIKKGDNVQVLSGNDKGKTGEVLEVIPKVLPYSLFILSNMFCFFTHKNYFA